jgi:hypothetical protein
MYSVDTVFGLRSFRNRTAELPQLTMRVLCLVSELSWLSLLCSQTTSLICAYRANSRQCSNEGGSTGWKCHGALQFQRGCVPL